MNQAHHSYYQRLARTHAAILKEAHIADKARHCARGEDHNLAGLRHWVLDRPKLRDISPRARILNMTFESEAKRFP